jgi:hypothetical protein
MPVIRFDETVLYLLSGFPAGAKQRAGIQFEYGGLYEIGPGIAARPGNVEVKLRGRKG